MNILKKIRVKNMFFIIFSLLLLNALPFTVLAAELSTDLTAPIVTAVPTSDSQISLTWSSSTGAVGAVTYGIYKDSSTTTLATTFGNDFNDVGLTASTTYRYVIVASDESGGRATSTEVSATTLSSAATLVAPVVTATSISPNQIDLSWAAATGGTGTITYGIFKDGATQSIATTTELDFSDASLLPATPHSYVIVATDDIGNRATSTVVTATTKPFTAPVLTAIPISSNRIDLSWSSTTEAVTTVTYSVYRNNSTITTTAGNNYSDTGLLPSTTYSYRVVAADEAGNRATSTEVTATTLNGTSTSGLTKPIVTAIPVSATQINLTWSSSTQGVGDISYRIYRNGSTSTTATTFGNEFNDVGLATSTTYRYIVVATDTAGSRATSTEVTATTLGTGTTTPSLTKPIVTATSTSPTQINLTWSSSTQAVGKVTYGIYRNSSTSTIATTFGNEFNDVGLSASTTYKYIVVATDEAGNKATSSEVSATTKSATSTIILSAPKNLNAIPLFQVQLNWSSSTATNTLVAGYKIYRNDLQIATTTLTTYLDTGLNPSTNYTYKIAAFDAAGNISDFAIINVTTQGHANGSSGGGGGGGGGWGGPITPPLLTAINVPLIILPLQAGIVEFNINKNYIVSAEIPRDAISTTTTFKINSFAPRSNMFPKTANTFFLGNNVFDLTANDNLGQESHDFLKDIMITVQTQLPNDINNLRAYYLNDKMQWELIPSARFNKGTNQIVFKARHLSTFAIIDTAENGNFLPINNEVKGVKIYGEGSLIRGLDHRIYLIKNWTRSYVSNLQELRKYIGRRINNVNDETLNAYRQVEYLGGYSDGELIRDKNKNVYLISNQNKQPIRTLAELQKYIGKKINNLDI